MHLRTRMTIGKCLFSDIVPVSHTTYASSVQAFLTKVTSLPLVRLMAEHTLVADLPTPEGVQHDAS